MRAEMKIPGGKLIAAEVDVRDGIIEEIHFYGDFFLHPEEKIEELEGELRERNVGEMEDIIRRVLSDAEMAGVSIDDFITIAKKAMEAD